MTVSDVIAMACSLVAIGSAMVVALSRNLVHSAFALLGVFAGVLGLFVLSSADFVAIVQLVVAIGGILVLILFAVMLTTTTGHHRFLNRAMAPAAAAILVAAIGGVMGVGFVGWLQPKVEVTVAPTTAAIGELLLGRYLLPFEIASLVLVLVLVGAVVLARREVA